MYSLYNSSCNMKGDKTSITPEVLLAAARYTSSRHGEHAILQLLFQQPEAYASITRDVHIVAAANEKWGLNILNLLMP